MNIAEGPSQRLPVGAKQPELKGPHAPGTTLRSPQTRDGHARPGEAKRQDVSQRVPEGHGEVGNEMSAFGSITTALPYAPHARLTSFSTGTIA
jgi:hypothetical protein